MVQASLHEQYDLYKRNLGSLSNTSSGCPTCPAKLPARAACYWVAVKELKLSYQNGYIYIVINMVSQIE